MNAQNNITININALTAEQLELLKELVFTAGKFGGDDDWAAKISQINDRQFFLEA